MAISKRLRYQVLRRDNYTCRYCGAFAPLAVLVIDHVTPRKLGGLDLMENLVTACEGCNSGKSAAAPESWLVAEVEEAAREWQGLPAPELNEDDLYEMEVYQKSLYALVALTSDEVLHCIAQAYQAAMPYRPTHSELIRCAGAFAERRHSEITPGMADNGS